MPDAAITRPLTIPKRQALVHQATSRTRLAARKEPVHQHHPAAVPLRLVLQLPPQLEQAQLGNAACQAPVLHHARHVQILNPHDRLGSRQSRGHLVQRVFPDVADFPMQPTNPIRRLATVSTALHLPADRPLQAGQFPQAGSQRLRVLVHRAVAHDRQRLDPQIHPNHCLLVLLPVECWLFHLHQHAHEPPPRLLAHRGIEYLGVGRQVILLLEPDRAETRKLDAVAGHRDRTRQPEPADPFLLALVLREPDLPLLPLRPKVAERPIQISQSFLSRTLAALVHPRHFGLLDGVQPSMEFDVVRDFRLGFQSGFLLVQAPIVRPPCRPCMLFHDDRKMTTVIAINPDEE